MLCVRMYKVHVLALLSHTTTLCIPCTCMFSLHKHCSRCLPLTTCLSTPPLTGMGSSSVLGLGTRFHLHTLTYSFIRLACRVGHNHHDPTVLYPYIHTYIHTIQQENLASIKFGELPITHMYTYCSIGGFLIC